MLSDINKLFFIKIERGKIMIRKNRKTLVIAAALAAVMLIGGVSAYFTSTDTAENTWTVGNIKIDLQEPGYDEFNEAEAENMTPNKVIHKDPQVKNTGDNDAYVFIKVSIPKANVATAAQDGAKEEAALQELFDYGINSGWVKVAEDTSAADKNTYVFAYGTETECTALAKNEVTSVLFKNADKEGLAEAGAVGFITFKNVIEGQGLENITLNIPVEAFGIQTTDLTAADASSPAEVWAVINNQSGIL